MFKVKSFSLFYRSIFIKAFIIDSSLVSVWISTWAAPLCWKILFFCCKRRAYSQVLKEVIKEFKVENVLSQISISASNQVQHSCTCSNISCNHFNCNDLYYYQVNIRYIIFYYLEICRSKLQMILELDLIHYFFQNWNFIGTLCFRQHWFWCPGFDQLLQNQTEVRFHWHTFFKLIILESISNQSILNLPSKYLS